MDASVQGLSASTKITGVGTLKWPARDSLGTPATIEIRA